MPDTLNEELDTATPADIYEKLIADVAVHGEATENFINSFQFYGRSLKDHSEALWIELPDSPTPEQIRIAYVELIRNIQIANHYLNVASSINGALSNGTQIKKADLIAAIIRNYDSGNKKRPAAAVISSMADSYLSGTANVGVASKIVKDFWRNKLDSLIEVRKCLESYSMSIASEMKNLGKSA